MGDSSKPTRRNVNLNALNRDQFNSIDHTEKPSLDFKLKLANNANNSIDYGEQPAFGQLRVSKSGRLDQILQSHLENHALRKSDSTKTFRPKPISLTNSIATKSKRTMLDEYKSRSNL